MIKCPKYIFSFILVLLFALPFHAFLVTVINAAFFDFAGSAPMFLRIWKEVLLAFILSASCVHIIPHWKNIRFANIDWCILVFFGIGLALIPFTFRNFKELFLGIKYDYIFIGAFFVLKQFTYSQKQQETLIRTIFLSAGLMLTFGLFFYVFFPNDIFTSFGYSHIHSRFHPDAALPYCHKVSLTDQCRLQSTLAGPNQLGTYLLIVLPLLLASSFRNMQTSSIIAKIKHIFTKRDVQIFQNMQNHKYEITLFTFGIIALFFTFSRGAWIGFFVSLLTFFYMLTPNKKHFRQFAILVGGSSFFLGILWYIFDKDFIETHIIRISSSTGHWETVVLGINYMLQYPFGLGLGRAGPASGRMAQDYHGLIPENWYIQIGLELGFLGMFMFLAIICFALMWMYKQCKDNPVEKSYHLAILCSLLGISVMCMVLPSWEDSAVSITFWILLAVFFQKLSYKKQ